MTGLLPILTRWRVGLSIAAAVALAGLVLGLQHYRSAYHAERTLRQADRASYIAAQSIAARLAQEALRHQEHIYVVKAKETEHEYVVKMADARTAADRYIAANRVRGQALAGNPSAAIASAEDRSARIPDQMPAVAVLVSEGDVRACTDASAYAVAAHQWAVGLKTGR